MTWMNPEGIMLSEISQMQKFKKKKRKAWSHLYVKSNDIKYAETESKMVVSRGVEVGETRRCRSEGTKLHDDQVWGSRVQHDGCS